MKKYILTFLIFPAYICALTNVDILNYIDHLSLENEYELELEQENNISCAELNFLYGRKNALKQLSWWIKKYQE